MKKFLFIILFQASFFCNAQIVQKVYIPNDYSNYSLEKFINEISQINNLNFYFNPAWILGVKVNMKSDSIFLNYLLDKLVIFGKLDYYISKAGNIYLLPQNELVKELPVYSSVKNQVIERTTSSNTSGFLISRDANTQTTIEVGKPGGANSSKKVKVIGHLIDGSNNGPLIGATIYIKNIKIGAATGTNGELVINLKPETYSAVFQCMGMQEINCQLKVYSSGSFTLKMTQNILSIDEVMVKKESVKRGTKSGIESIDFLAIKEMPSLMGEKDVLKIAQMLPGIVSVSEGSGGVNVRGGNADQNLFYIDKIPVYNSSHLFGFFSSVNSSIVENFSIYKGQVPVNFGGRLSSVLDVQTRSANKNKFFTEGGISPISANIVIETPIVKDKIGLMISGRTTYSNWILKQMKDPDLRKSKASFYDILTSVDYDIDKKSKLSILGYLSNDFFNLNNLTSYSYGNTGGVLEFSHRFLHNLKLSACLVGSNYHFQTINETSLTEAYEHQYRIGHFEVKTEIDWVLHKNHTFKGGFSNILYNLERGDVIPYGNESLKTTVSLGKEHAMEGSFFLGDEMKIGSRLTIYAGLRYSYYNELGPKRVRMYKENSEEIDLNVERIKEYANNEKITSYSGPEYRAGLDFRAFTNGSFKFSFTQMRQYLFMLSNTISIAPDDQWKLADSHLKPQNSMQYSVGYYHHLKVPELLVSFEVYYKDGEDIVEYKDGADFLSTPYVETNILQGKQNSYGAEFMISKEKGRLNGWISYTYSRSNITVNGLNKWEKINNGKPYPSNFDKPHVLNMVLNWKINRRFSISSNVVYNSGRPVTLPVGYYYLEGFPYVDYSSRNEYRMPDYFRTDLSVKIEGNLKKKKKAHSYWMFSVYNFTGRENVNSIFFKSEEGYIRGYQYSVIGVPIYTISWNWKLGNYENN
jgi:hypothetical protein